jgi:signal transduction histidine kinase
MDSIDWRTVFMMPPRRRFTAAELQRAVPQGLSSTLKAAVALNLALPLGSWAVLDAGKATPAFILGVLASVLGLLWAGLAAWRDPGSRYVRWTYFGMPLAMIGLALLLKRSGVPKDLVLMAAMLLMAGSLLLWFAIVHRHQYIVMRLAEMDERDRAIEMARRLAAAQLEPHFLFNTLASLQHWVQTKDDRAAPMLDALVGYLRATLPMFGRPMLAAGTELEAVRRYLQVMEARLGARLQWQIDVPEALLGVALPPGLLLTLVENAIEHGIEPQLAGGHIGITARPQGTGACFEVRDTGPGLAAGATDGVGLANNRERLGLLYGPAARLSIASAEAGGCVARIELDTLKTA